MYCENCGAKLEDKATFCDECGYDVKKKDRTFKSTVKKYRIVCGVLAAACLGLLAATLITLHEHRQYVESKESGKMVCTAFTSLARMRSCRPADTRSHQSMEKEKLISLFTPHRNPTIGRGRPIPGRRTRRLSTGRKHPATNSGKATSSRSMIPALCSKKMIKKDRGNRSRGLLMCNKLYFSLMLLMN